MTRTKIMAMALFASLALNVFAGAALLRPVFGPPHHRGHHGPDKAQMEALSDETRTAMRALWDQNRDGMRVQFRAIREARRDVAAALTAKTFDEQAVRDAQAKLDGASARSRALINQSVIESARLMSDEERKAFFERGLHRYRFGKGGHHRPPPPDANP